MVGVKLSIEEDTVYLLSVAESIICQFDSLESIGIASFVGVFLGNECFECPSHLHMKAQNCVF